MQSNIYGEIGYIQIKSNRGWWQKKGGCKKYIFKKNAFEPLIWLPNKVCRSLVKPEAILYKRSFDPSIVRGKKKFMKGCVFQDGLQLCSVLPLSIKVFTEYEILQLNQLQSYLVMKFSKGIKSRTLFLGKHYFAKRYNEMRLYITN